LVANPVTFQKSKETNRNKPMAILNELDKLLRSNIKKYQVPGASLAILRNGKIVGQTAAGVVNLDTGVKTTTQSVFQIGSITKPQTATLIMQLVDEGRLDLDDRVMDHLPDFRVSRLDVSRAVTIRQLLCHSSGIDGDFFVDAGRGDDAVERLLDKAVMVPSLFEPGQMMAYCNLGYVVLGRIIEVLRRKSYDQALKDHLFEPLGMTHAFSRPEDALRFNCAIGHIPSKSKKGKWHVAREPYLSFGQKSAGATPAMTAGDLLKFAAMHMSGGKTREGKTFLSRSSVKAMQRRQIKTLKHAQNAINGWGLSWFLMDWEGHKLYGHDGATLGQFAFLRILPEKNLAVALLTNGGDALGLYRATFEEIFSDLAKTWEPKLPEPAEKQPELSSFVGVYQNMVNEIELSMKKGRLFIKGVHRETQMSLYPEKSPLTFLDKNTARFATGNPIQDRATLLFSFYNEKGRPNYLQTGLRQYRRV
jgi:CubicO group peptidase (beta-lactamase class C family)